LKHVDEEPAPDEERCDEKQGHPSERAVGTMRLRLADGVRARIDRTKLTLSAGRFTQLLGKSPGHLDFMVAPGGVAGEKTLPLALDSSQRRGRGGETRGS
jgi:hypothetical protein